MAGEIALSFPSDETLYALVRIPADETIYDVGDDEMQAIGTWNDARAGECDIVMTPSGNLHLADFPASLEENTYLVQICLQDGANPAAADTVLAQGEMLWNGEAEKTVGTILIEQQTVKIVGKTEEPPDTRKQIIL